MTNTFSDIILNAGSVDSKELEHAGVKGMRWGVKKNKTNIRPGQTSKKIANIKAQLSRLKARTVGLNPPDPNRVVEKVSNKSTPPVVSKKTFLAENKAKKMEFTLKSMYDGVKVSDIQKKDFKKERAKIHVILKGGK